MGKYDKDRFQKELAVRFCLSKKLIPFLEVVTNSSSDLSDTNEVLTDLDVAATGLSGGGDLRWIFFDCKSSAKLSGINRAFWAAGLMRFVKYDHAFVILKNKPVHNHRLSSLTINVDLHSEGSFKELGQAQNESFANDLYYQSSLDRWEKVYADYFKNKWSEGLYNLSRHSVPLTSEPTKTFRNILSEFKSKRGEFDPNKKEHLSIYLDIMASTLVLWASLAYDIRRFYDNQMDKTAFEKILRYYIWGGKENYEIRQKLKRMIKEDGENAELPAWNKLLTFAGITVSSPQSLLECAHICRELSIREASEINEAFDDNIKAAFSANNRLRQFIMGMNNYLQEAASLPTDMSQKTNDLLSQF